MTQTDRSLTTGEHRSGREKWPFASPTTSCETSSLSFASRPHFALIMDIHKAGGAPSGQQGSGCQAGQDHLGNLSKIKMLEIPNQEAWKRDPGFLFLPSTPRDPGSKSPRHYLKLTTASPTVALGQGRKSPSWSGLPLSQAASPRCLGHHPAAIALGP